MLEHVGLVNKLQFAWVVVWVCFLCTFLRFVNDSIGISSLSAEQTKVVDSKYKTRACSKVGFDVLASPTVNIYNVGCDAMYYVRSSETFRMNILPPSSAARTLICCLILVASLLGLPFDSEDGGSTFLRNVDGLLISLFSTFVC
jgi:hypothetical protein